jgi:hypothetical protein
MLLLHDLEYNTEYYTPMHPPGKYSLGAPPDDLSVLVAVAEQACQAITESLRYSPRESMACLPGGVWWCSGGDGHMSAEIGR